MTTRRQALAQAGAAVMGTALAAPQATRAQPRPKPLKVVDSQVHLWREGKPSAIHRQRPTYWAEDLLAEMGPAGVDAVVICPPGFFPEGNDLYRDIVQRHPDRFATWGYFPVTAPDREQKIKTWREPPYELGLRYTFLAPPTRDYWTNGAMDWLWPAAEEAGVPLGFYGQGHLDVIADKAQRHPRLKIIVDHMAADVMKKGPGAFEDVPKLLTMAKYPNVAVKVSGAPAQSLQPYPFRDMHDYIKRCFDAFGPARSMWGTDLTRQPCSYRQCVTMFTEEMPWLKGEDLRMVMGEALMRWLDWRPQGWTV